VSRRQPAGVRLRGSTVDGVGGETGLEPLASKLVNELIEAADYKQLSAAIVDRLTFAGQIIETGTTSYRLAHARQRHADGRDRK
jgi:hypothetical protein